MVRPFSARARLPIVAAAAGALAIVASAPRIARADDPVLSACIAQNESSIQRRTEHKLLEARTLSQKCAADECPAVLREACKKRIGQIDAALPTIVFDVKDLSGASVVARVSMDGQSVSSAPGSPISTDPGEHRFTFEAEGRPPVERVVTLREGERDRHEPIMMAPAPALTLPVTPPPEVASTSWSTQKTLALVAGGVGVAGVALGSIFGLAARSSWSSSQSDCPSSTNCPQHAQAVSDHDSAASSATLATIAFAAGGAALAAGAVLWFTAPHAEATRTAATSGVRIAPAAGPSGAGLLVTGAF